MFLFYFFLFSVFGNFASFSNKIYAEEIIEILETTENLESSNLEIVKEKENKEEVLNSVENLNEEIKIDEEIKVEKDLPKEILEIPKLEEVKKEEIKTENTSQIKVQAVDYSATKIRINEIFPNPVGDENDNEFIEIFNYGEEKVDLTKFKLVYFANNLTNPINPTKKDYPLKENLESGKFFVLKDEIISLRNNDTSGQFVTISLKTIDDKLLSEITYYKSIEGQSLNFDENEWYWIDPTPNAENLENPLNKDYSKYNVRINEILASTNGTNCENEFIEIYNPNPVDLVGWKLRDKNIQDKFNDKNINCSSGCGEFIFKTENDIYILKESNELGFSINDSNETIYLVAPNNKIFQEIQFQEKIATGRSLNFDLEKWYETKPTPNAENLENPTTKNYPKILINEVLPDPNGTDTGNEFIELYNPNDFSVNLKNWILKDTSSSQKVFGDFEMKPFEYKVFYQNTDFSFSLNNDGDIIYLKTPNPNIQTSFSYENSQEGLSINFDEKENYPAKPTPNLPNNENSLTKNYPNLILNEILPNPAGDEEVNEFIEIYNPNNFEVSLENWILKDSSATGNYIFSENQKISANSYLTIYRSDFEFALNNSGGETVFLISPNQKVQSEIIYESASENVSYNFNQQSQTWRWSKFLTPNSANLFNNLPEIKKFSVDEKAYKNVYVNFKVKATDLDGDELKYTWNFGDGRKSYKAETYHKYLKAGIYQASLKIYDGSEEVIKNFTISVKKYPKYDLEIVKIVPNPKGLDSLGEYIVIKNNSNKKVDFKNWSLATGSVEEKLYNHPIRENLEIKAGKSEKITRKLSAFSLSNKKGYLELRQPDGEVADKIFYEKEKIEDDEAFEKIGKKWEWIASEENQLNSVEAQKIIAQALENEKKWQEENLESKVAGEVIQREENKENKKEIPMKEMSFLEKVSTEINYWLNKGLPNLKDFLASFWERNYLA